MIETIGQDLIEVVNHLQEENKRYREVLEEIAEEMHLGGDSKYVTEEKLIRVIIRARKALEESK